MARAARVSRQTVSNVLNAPDLVHSSTRRRVEAVIKDFTSSLETLKTGDPKAILARLQRNGEAALK